MAEDKKQNQSKKTSSKKKGSVEGNMNILEATRTVAEKSKLKHIPTIANMDYFKSYTYGIPIRQYPVLCRLLGTDVLALSRSMTIAGPQKSLKTSLGWFLMKLIIKAGGFVIYLDTEHKQSPELIRAIIDEPSAFDENNPRVIPISCDTKDQAEDLLYNLCSRYEELTNGNKIPMGVLWDSLNGGASQAEIDAQEGGDDSPGYGKMHEAASLQKSMQTSISKSINKKPILFAGINHEKERVVNQATGAKEKYEPGGSFKEFAWTWKLRTSRKGQRQLAEGAVTTIGLKSAQNSLHEEQGVPIPVNFRVRYDDKGAAHARFDWETSTTMLLTDTKLFPKTRASKGICITESSKKYSCKELDIKDYPADLMGQIIQERPDIQERVLRNAFNIPKGGILKDGIIYQPDEGYDGEVVEQVGELRGMNIKYGEEPDIVTDPSWLQQNRWPDNIKLEKRYDGDDE